jgi:hypothetical protein
MMRVGGCVLGVAVLAGCATRTVPATAPCLKWQVGDERVPQLESVETVPDVALRGDAKARYAVRIAGGIVLGIDPGEWGGGLRVRTDAGRRVDLDKENVAGLLALPDGDALAALGRTHGRDDGGWLVRVSARDGDPRIVGRERLPSAPRLAQATRAGWLVVMANHQAVLVQPDLSRQPVACAVAWLD